MPKLKIKREKQLQKIALSVAGHAARGLGEGSRSSRMTAVVEQQLVSETVQHVTDESGSEYFPTPKKGRKIVELPQSSEEEHEVPPNCLFLQRFSHRTAFTRVPITQRHDNRRDQPLDIITVGAKY